jgi:glucose/arabinose dehydrogenase
MTGHVRAWLLVIPIFVLAVPAGDAQRSLDTRSNSVAPVLSGLPDKPVVLVSEDGQRLRVVPIATGLSHPWGMAFLPDGRSMLVTERPGRLRIIRNGVLDPAPIAGVPKVDSVYIGGLNDIALHPEFTKNQ